MAEFAPVFVTVMLGAAVEVTSRVLWAGAKKCTKVAKKGTKFAKQLTYSARENSRKRLTAAGSNMRSREMARISGASDGQQHEIRHFERRGGGSIQPYRSSDTTTEYEESAEVRRNGTKVYKRTNREITGMFPVGMFEFPQRSRRAKCGTCALTRADMPQSTSLLRVLHNERGTLSMKRIYNLNE
ncbi:unnamed protein product [Ectocarpus sp. 12 AP-2014]